jgi:YD repeat-containing protein
MTKVIVHFICFPTLLAGLEQLALRFATEAGQPSYTGPVYVDSLAMRGMVASATDAKTPATTIATYTYDWNNQKTTVLQSFKYDYGFDVNGARTTGYSNGNVVKVTELDGSEVAYSYDDLNRLVTAVRTGTYPYTQSYEYDKNDNRTKITVGGVVTSASYDEANQMTAFGGTSYTYDRNGNLTGAGSDSLSYDQANLWTTGTIGGTSVSFGYDGHGRRSSRTVSGNRTDYWYDVSGAERGERRGQPHLPARPGGAATVDHQRQHGLQLRPRPAWQHHRPGQQRWNAVAFAGVRPVGQEHRRERYDLQRLPVHRHLPEQRHRLLSDGRQVLSA